MSLPSAGKDPSARSFPLASVGGYETGMDGTCGSSAERSTIWSTE